MLYRKIGSLDMDASVVALGAWAMGGWMWGGTDDQQSIKTIHTALDSGINFIDTAAIYGFGHSEKIVGQALKNKRDKVILATKCGLVWDQDKGEFYFHSSDEDQSKIPSTHVVHRYLGPESIAREIEESLSRLQTDYIDLYQTHRQESTTPIEDTMAMLLKLKDQGKIRAIGVSNVTINQCLAYGSLDSAQERFSMFDRHIVASGLVDYCRKNQVAILAYSPLEQGLLTGKIGPERTFHEGDQRREKPLFSIESRQRINDMLRKIQPIAQKHKATLAQITIAWTFSFPGITHVLCGARTPEQAQENAYAGQIQLTDQEIKQINQILDQSGLVKGNE